MQVNLDEVVSYLRELLYMNRAQLLSEIGDTSKRFGDRSKKTDLIAFALEKKFDPKVRLPVIAGQLGAKLVFGRRTEP